MRVAAIISATAVTLSYFTSTVAAINPADLLASAMCSSNQFYYPKAKKCLITGGPRTANKRDKDCGGKDWYLLNSVCVPRYPNSPVPRCPKGRVFRHMMCKARCSRVGTFWFGDGRKCVQEYAGGIPAHPPVAPVHPTPTHPTSCPEGYHYDPSAAACLLNQSVSTCPTNWHYDTSAATCLPNADHHQYNPTCLDGYVWSRITLNCVKLQPIGPPRPSQGVFRSASLDTEDSDKGANVDTKASVNAATVGDGGDDDDEDGGGDDDGDANADDASLEDTQNQSTPTLQRRDQRMSRIFKRHQKPTLVSRSFCPVGLTQCPARGEMVEQCRELVNDPEACGSCDNNCLLIKGIKSPKKVECVRGVCQVGSCKWGFSPSLDGQSCVHAGKGRRPHF